MITSVPFIIAIIGLLVYGFVTIPKIAEIGRIAFFVGLMWVVYGLIGTKL